MISRFSKPLPSSGLPSSTPLSSQLINLNPIPSPTAIPADQNPSSISNNSYPPSSVTLTSPQLNPVPTDNSLLSVDPPRNSIMPSSHPTITHISQSPKPTTKPFLKKPSKKPIKKQLKLPQNSKDPRIQSSSRSQHRSLPRSIAPSHILKSKSSPSASSSSFVPSIATSPICSLPLPSDHQLTFLNKDINPPHTCPSLAHACHSPSHPFSSPANQETPTLHSPPALHSSDLCLFSGDLTPSQSISLQTKSSDHGPTKFVPPLPPSKQTTHLPAPLPTSLPSSDSLPTSKGLPPKNWKQAARAKKPIGPPLPFSSPARKLLICHQNLHKTPHKQTLSSPYSKFLPPLSPKPFKPSPKSGKQKKLNFEDNSLSRDQQLEIAILHVPSRLVEPGHQARQEP